MASLFNLIQPFDLNLSINRNKDLRAYAHIQSIKKINLKYESL